MWRLTFRFMIIFTLGVTLLEATLLGSRGDEAVPGQPGLVAMDSNLRLGQRNADLASYTCWGLMEYTASCRVEAGQWQDVTVQIAIRENTIVMATYEADSLLNIYTLVEHWGAPLSVEQRSSEIYVSWEHFVYGVITPNLPTQAPGYTLTAWSEA